jgi:hypothetical protein
VRRNSHRIIGFARLPRRYGDNVGMVMCVVVQFVSFLFLIDTSPDRVVAVSLSTRLKKLITNTRRTFRSDRISVGE